jgi:ABC-2 type transport system permease protein/oleandomycin transport system permease protein
MAVLVFASTAFVPARTMPGWLQAYASHQPVSDVADAVRSLVLGGPTAGNVLIAIAWCVGIVAVFAPLAVARYRKVA